MSSNSADASNTGRPPSRDELREGNDATTPAPAAHAYGQSAPTPSSDLAEGETAAPSRPIAKSSGHVEDEHDTIDDLADEPIFDSGTDDTDHGRTRGEHLDGEPETDVDADSELLEALGDVPPGAEDNTP